ncbi:Gp9 [Mycolicibacterium canariasense]|uniref:Gp9 n=1 Tax=Mycolicibacterium canariasense TaxID=228230 RepID=A0A124E351_MYCCR|nr:hypothetical protein [Mycolicibacterium canariasense]MCV7210161.1 hypothetical protein [Mycolicibacterium canariasense]ORU97866.1 hypothetical protein AWB94_29375 [Mycolicibacterium canariasense]GAS98809.1 Gp9 [Mycolicibacterium canariasense]
MACACRGGRRAGQTTSQGVVAGFKVVYPDGSEHPNLFDTSIEAKKHTLVHGGTYYQVMQS